MRRLLPSLFRRCAPLLGAAWLIGVPEAALAQQPPQLQRCQACHGPQGNSTDPLTPSLAGQPRIFIENQLVLIRDGLRDIPQMKGVLDELKDADLIVLAQYFAAQSPAPALSAVDGARYARGQALAGAMLCASCHRPDFSGREQIPRLAGQPEPYLRRVMAEYRDNPGPGRDTVMSGVLYGVSHAQLDDLAHFLSRFHQ